MLVLTRKRSEKIVIGDDILITVISVSGQSVRLGITAPTETPICRTELLNRMIERTRSENSQVESSLH